MASLFGWWKTLSDETRNLLMEDPHGHVPPDLVPEVVRAGEVVGGAWWAETQRGPSGLSLSAEAQRFVWQRSRMKKRDDLIREQDDILMKYFPAGSQPPYTVAGTGFPDDETRERFYALDDLIRDANRAYRESFIR